MSCIFIFRRDLRLTDNTALIRALQTHTEVLPVFIYDHTQLHTDHVSTRFLEMQEQALQDLETYISKHGGVLCRFYGTPHKVVTYLIQTYKPKTVAFNLDYSMYAVERDKAIVKVCETMGVTVLTAHDVTIYDPPVLREKFNKKYGEFCMALTNLDFAVHRNGISKYAKKTFPGQKTSIPLDITTHKSEIQATRVWTLNRIKTERENYKISCALKLGLVSPREVFQYAVNTGADKLIKNMLWREFYFAAWLAKTNHYDFYDERFRNIEWRNDPVEMKAMWTGATGFPLVDAAMAELNTTGFMCNRGRLIVGFFSVKILRINPFYTGRADGYYAKLFAGNATESHKAVEWNVGGQLYFSRKLIDCCYANNTGNWHWVASDLLDASGQRFGHGWSGRKMSITKLKSGDEEYIKKWSPTPCTPIVDVEERWREWLGFTSQKN